MRRGLDVEQRWSRCRPRAAMYRERERGQPRSQGRKQQLRPAMAGWLSSTVRVHSNCATRACSCRSDSAKIRSISRTLCTTAAAALALSSCSCNSFSRLPSASGQRELPFAFVTRAGVLGRSLCVPALQARRFKKRGMGSAQPKWLWVPLGPRSLPHRGVSAPDFFGVRLRSLRWRFGLGLAGAHIGLNNLRACVSQLCCC